MPSTPTSDQVVPAAGRKLNKELNPVRFEPRAMYGQGKRVTTITGGEGHFYPIIAHDAKNDNYDRMRVNSAPQGRQKRGLRPMHKTTIAFARTPWEPDYMTTNMQYHGGSNQLDPVSTPRTFGNMRRSQIVFGGYGNYAGYPGHEFPDPNTWKTDYTQTYFQKDIIPANRLHFTSLVNRMNQGEGAQMKEVVRPGQHPMPCFTQYKRVHDKLGNLLGPGVPREYPVREQYNILTGEPVGPAWRAENRSVSGNRVLHGIRSADLPVPIQ